MSTIRQSQLLLLSFFIGFFFILVIFDFENLKFDNTNWITSYDTISDFLALKFFLKDHWSFPLGLNSNYGNVENSIVFSGAVPILSFLAKSIKNFLPENFHYFQIWIYLCLSLQFFFSFKIFSLFTKNNLICFFCAFFFLFLPILYFRISIHLSLGAHWLILAYFYYEFKECDKSENKKIFLILLSSLIHFYMTIILLVTKLFFDLDKFLKKNNFKKNKIILLYNLKLFFLLLSLMYIVGYFTIPSIDSLGYGYGIYKFNLLSFFDPIPSGSNQNWSLILKDIPNFSGEHEGFAYLGLGGILAMIISSYLYWKNDNILVINKKYIFLVLFFTILAITNNISFGNLKIFSFDLPNILYGPLSVIRASGRFIWPVYYLMIIFFFVIIIKSKIKLSYIIIILIIQIIDTSFLFKKNLYKIDDRIIDYEGKYIEFQFKDKRNLISSYPSDNSNIFFKTSDLLIKGNFDNTNIFRLGRYNRSMMSINRNKLYRDFIEKKIDANTLYVIENFDHLRHLKEKLKNTNHGFFNFKDTWYLIANSKDKMTDLDYRKLESFNFNSISKNVPYIPRFKDRSGFLGLGWSHGSYGKTIDQSSSVWTEGNQSFIIFSYDGIENINTLELDIEKVMLFKEKPLKMKLFLNDNYLIDLKFNTDEPQKIKIDINNFLKKGNNEISLQIENPVSPVSMFQSVDGRLLGVNIKNLNFY